ncbi:MAG TPA: RecX family transcriptional regulator [Candidatus Sumerlaeota bacterium]|nr:RecX family transcriptional regulator [Candidatus Sumerlaeota bacterium]HPK01797.1 RecX family transcriptional regulator [Candidatus Sumerlaeota bacterium]
MPPEITEFKALGKRRQRIMVYLDGAPWAELDPETVVRERLSRGQNLDEAARAALLRADEQIRARKAAAGHAAGGRKTRHELEQYLRERRFSPRAIAGALQALAESETIDDEQVAGRHIRRRRRGRDLGPRRLEAELVARGIEPRQAESLVDKTFSEVDVRRECRELAARAAARYQPLTEPKQRRRLAAWLLRRGYGQEDVESALEWLRTEVQETGREPTPD